MNLRSSSVASVAVDTNGDDLYKGRERSIAQPQVGCLPEAAAAPGSTGCATAFPAPLALGATFDDELFAEVGRAIAREARALNNFNFAHNSSQMLLRHHNAQALTFFAPNVNL